MYLFRTFADTIYYFSRRFFMEKGLCTHVSKGDVKNLPGRDAIWLQTPETTGGNYTTVSTTFYQPGVKVAPAHSHPYGEETGYVVSGHGKVLIGDQVFEVEPGSVFLFPQGVPHMVWNSGNEVMQLLFVYANGPKASESIPHEDVDFPE